MKVIKRKDPRILTAFKDLLTPPVIIRVNRFTETAATEFHNSIEEAHNTGQPVIPVIVDSYGGEVYSLLSMISEIDNSTLPVVTIGMGKCMSCGSILVAYGTPGMRYIAEDTTVMVHDVSMGSRGKVEDLKASVKEGERLRNLIMRKMALRCGHKDKDHFIKIMESKRNVDWYLSARDAKKHKVVDHIGVPNLEVDVSVNIQLVIP
jgi:ATP-dependent Clp protease protease subunit